MPGYGSRVDSRWRLGFLAQRAFADVADDADDLVGPLPSTKLDLLADGSVWEVAFRERFVDQEHSRFFTSRR
jgi:hypothetical protein